MSKRAKTEDSVIVFLSVSSPDEQQQWNDYISQTLKSMSWWGRAFWGKGLSHSGASEAAVYDDRINPEICAIVSPTYAGATSVRHIPNLNMWDHIFAYVPFSRIVQDANVVLILPMGLQKTPAAMGYTRKSMPDRSDLNSDFYGTLKVRQRIVSDVFTKMLTAIQQKYNRAWIMTRFAMPFEHEKAPWTSKMLRKWSDTFPKHVQLNWRSYKSHMPIRATIRGSTFSILDKNATVNNAKHTVALLQTLYNETDPLQLSRQIVLDIKAEDDDEDSTLELFNVFWEFYDSDNMPSQKCIVCTKKYTHFAADGRRYCRAHAPDGTPKTNNWPFDDLYKRLTPEFPLPLLGIDKGNHELVEHIDVATARPDSYADPTAHSGASYSMLEDRLELTSRTNNTIIIPHVSSKPPIATLVNDGFKFVSRLGALLTVEPVVHSAPFYADRAFLTTV